MRQVVLSGRYLLGETLGEGSVGKVKRCTDLVTKAELACKIIPRRMLRSPEDLYKEIRVMQRLVGNRRVVQYVEVLATDTEYYIIMEFARGGELFARIQVERGMPEADARRYFREMCEGVAFLHQQGVVHRDIKLENCLLDENGSVKIADFGLSAIVSNVGDPAAALCRTDCGSPQYAAPEVLRNQPYDGRAADVWSLGVVLFACCTGCLPWTYAATTCERYTRYSHGQLDYEPWPRVQGALRALLCHMLSIDATRRPTVAEVLQDPWVVGLAAPAPVPAFLPPPSPGGVPADRDTSGATSTGSMSMEAEPAPEVTVHPSPYAAMASTTVQLGAGAAAAPVAPMTPPQGPVVGGPSAADADDLFRDFVGTPVDAVERNAGVVVPRADAALPRRRTRVPVFSDDDVCRGGLESAGAAVVVYVSGRGGVKEVARAFGEWASRTLGGVALSERPAKPGHEGEVRLRCELLKCAVQPSDERVRIELRRRKADLFRFGSFTNAAVVEWGTKCGM